MRNISPVVKDDDIEKKKHTHSVSDISDFPEIPDETAISGMGFTKNSGDYSKPNGGIPKSDLASAVQTSLSKADTALQEHQSLAEYVKADDARLTDARPANGGNAETVNGHTINADVPANAVFTDTTYEPATTSSDGLMSAADKTKLDDIEKGANKTIVDDTLSETSKNPLQNDVTTKALNNKAAKTHKHKVSDITDFPESLPASDVSEWAKAATKPTYSASEVGADAAGSAAKALADAKAYTDGEIADIINGAPTTLDTLGEIADAMEENADVVAALDKAIGKKANTDDLTSHTNNTANPHNVTKNQVGLGNVPNVATNDQTPTYSDAASLETLTSGEKLSVAFGKISKAITDLISHIGDSVKHITSAERTNWNAAKSHADSAHAPSNAQANVIETVKVNGTALTPSSKAVNITVPTVGNGTITIKQAGTTKGTFTTNQSGNTTIELADNNTWRDVVDNLTSTDATKSLSANQGKVLKGLVDGKAAASHTHSAYVNQNAFSNVVVGSTTVAADTATDTLTLVGSNVTLTPDVTNDKVTIGITKANVTSALGYTPPTTNTTYEVATQSANGLMSAADKKKLDGLSSGGSSSYISGAYTGDGSKTRTISLGFRPCAVIISTVDGSL